jgi:hypothetical protein
VTPPVPYADNAARHASDGEKEAQLSKVIARLRLTTFLIAAAILLWALSSGVTGLPIWAAILLFVAFGFLVVWHARVDERAAWHGALRLVNLRGLSRRARDWQALPEAEAPPGLDLADHPYALDLDLFGRASLFQWLGPAATPRGRVALATWLLGPSPRTEVIERQEAVAQLSTLDDWRLTFDAHGVLAANARQHEIDWFLAWAEGPDLFGRKAGLLRSFSPRT